MNIQALGGASSVSGINSSQNALKKTNLALGKILEQLSTAKRVNRASDDPAGLAVAEQLSAQVRGFKAASQNISDAAAALDIAGGAGNEISAMLQRQRELSIQAKNDTLTADQRRMLDTEYQAITQEITRTAEVTNYNGMQLTSGQGLGSGNAQIQVGA
nr:flagellin [Chitinispirillaceae bacterium]